MTDAASAQVSDLFAGLMSGTSLDGVDAVLADFAASPPRLVAHYHVPFAADLRNRLLALHRPGTDELHRAALASNDLARVYAEAIGGMLRQTAWSAESIVAVGCHGQTVRHNPACGYTIQLNNPSLLAELTGISVVADFRSRDIAAGGQGAPLVPAFHEVLFRDPACHRVVVNLGGIANITNLSPRLSTGGFDCGPGNMLMDAWVREHRGEAYDRNGAWAAEGKPDRALLRKLRRHPFFAQTPPKSCGREQFNSDWLKTQLSGSEKPADVQATLLELTASSVADAIVRWCGNPDEVLVCGGGARNGALVERLGTLMRPAFVLPTDKRGVDASLVEALAFAWLARQALRRKAGNLPCVTGAKGERVLGAIYPR